MKNKSLNIFRSLCLGFLIAMGSCASEDLTVESSSEGSEGSKAIVNFSIDNKSAFFGEPGTASRAAATELQTETEKKITSLTAVVFKTTTAAGSKENDTDKFLMAKDITPAPTVDGTFNFSLGEEGNLWVCFVANAGNGLLSKIKALTAASSTVKNFKDLVSEEDPDGNDKLMVSGFHNIQASFTKPATIALVTLTRNMARIDIENASDGITITKILFHNRSVKSKLINDNSVTFDASMLPASPATPKSYDANLVGDSKNPTSLKSKIYSYEQFATTSNNSTTERPYLEVYYTVSGETGKTYKHNIYFEDNKKGPKAATAVQLKRNTLYTVTVKNSKSNIVFGITVKDWVAGKTFQVTTEQLIHGATTGPDYYNVAVGDFMLKDGTIVKPDAVSSHKADVIGVVFSTDESRIGAKAKEKLGGKAHGLVMALKEAGSGLAWKNENTASGLPFKNSMKDCYEDINGYDNTQQIFTKGGSSLSTTYSAFNAVKTYETQNKSPEGTTGWYLPAIGEWYDILENLGKVVMDNKFKENTLTGSQALSGSQVNSINTANNINTHLRKIGESYVNEFDVTSSQYRYYWSSSEYNENRARLMYFYNNGNLSVHDYYKNDTDSYFRVRCVLAF